MFGWVFTRRRTLYRMVTETAADYLKMTEEKGVRIQELEGKLSKVRQGRNAHVIELEGELRKAKDETEFVIGAFSSEIHKIKTDLQRLRLQDGIRDIEADIVKSQARAMYILGQHENIPWQELEKQVRLLSSLMALRQEYQQT